MKQKLSKKEETTSWGKRLYYSNQDNTIRFALYWYNDDKSTIYFSNLFVDEKYRNKGIADKILEFAFKYAKKHKYKNIILNVEIGSWMQKWYERKGFTFLERAKGEYVGNDWMIKNL